MSWTSSSSYTKSSNLDKNELTRDPTDVLDEYKVYFSTLWSPPPPKKHTNHHGHATDHSYVAYGHDHRYQSSNGACDQSYGTRNHHSSHSHHYYKANGEEDVDAEAEEFIAMKHKKFELTSWMSRTS